MYRTQIEVLVPADTVGPEANYTWMQINEAAGLGQRNGTVLLRYVIDRKLTAAEIELIESPEFRKKLAIEPGIKIIAINVGRPYVDGV